MDNIPEREQPKAERMVSLGEDFALFDPKYTKREFSRFPGVNNFKSQVKLSLGENLEIPFDLKTIASYGYKRNVITPFAPELGYRIDSEDLVLENRIAKMKRLDKELGQNIDFAKAPLVVVMISHNYQLYELGLNNKLDPASFKFSQEMLELLRRCRILVSFPQSRFEAMLSETSLFLGEINFSGFYPSDSGPLPAKEHSLEVREGFHIHLPSDPEKLSEIKARFVLAEEQPEKEQA